MPVTVTKTDLEALLNTSFDADTWTAAKNAVEDVLTAALPSGVTLAGVDASQPANLATLNNVFRQVAVRVLSNPTGAIQTGAEGVTVGYQHLAGGSDPLKLRKSELAALAGLTTPAGVRAGTPTSSMVVDTGIDW